MQNLTRPGTLRLKAALFLTAGLLTSALLLIEHPSLRTAFLLAVAVWSFGRLYYFFFYVADRYMAPEERASGIFALLWQRLRLSR